MSQAIKDLEPRLLFRHFEALVAIPRGSKFEDAARAYVVDWAREKGFDCRVDAIGNVAVAVPATPGHESAPAVILQGHLDIVWEKHSHVALDFHKDPIPAYVDGDHVRTRGTTLGADNGIGVAAAMAVAEDPDAVHGPLEILCTIDEETGMTGAFNLDPGILKGRIMLNLDSEDEGTIFVGCAGGGDTSLTLPVTRTPAPAGFVSRTLKVAGLLGGHSGLDIAKARGNAIKVLARALVAGGVLEGGILVSCIQGGSKRNAIPRESSACVWMAPDRLAAFHKAIDAFQDLMRIELGKADPGLELKIVDEHCADAPLDQAPALLRLLLALPHGPLVMNQDLVGLVDTSTNLAIVGIEGDEAKVLCNSRSSVASAMESVRQGLKAAVELAGGTAELTGQYPGWRPNLDSKILAVAKAVWHDRTGKDPEVTAIHAGLECGVIGERAPGMDTISFGPDIRGAHSPDERVSIPSTGRFYDYLKAILAKVA
jgi:dipeptidase D